MTISSLSDAPMRGHLFTTRSDGISFSEFFIPASSGEKFTYQVVGSIPLGLTLDTVQGRLIGTPLVVGRHALEVIATDSMASTARHTFELTIRPGTNDFSGVATRTRAFLDSNGIAIDVGANSTPTFVDLDDDGDSDLIIGNQAGRLHYYENTAGGFVARTGSENPFDGFDVGFFSAPTFADLDPTPDGDLDLLVGSDRGLKYWQNDGDGTFSEIQVVPFGLADLSQGTGQRNIPVVVKSSIFATHNPGALSGLYIGTSSGRIEHYTPRSGDGRFEASASVISQSTTSGNNAPFIGNLYSPAGSASVVYGSEDGMLYFGIDTRNPDPSEAVNQFAGIDVGANSTPTFADIDGDGDLDLVIGDAEGTLTLAEGYSLVYQFGDIPLHGAVSMMPAFVGVDDHSSTVTAPVTTSLNVIHTSPAVDTVQASANSADIFIAYGNMAENGYFVIDGLGEGATKTWSDFKIGQDRIIFVTRAQNILSITDNSALEALGLNFSIIQNAMNQSALRINGSNRTIDVSLDSTIDNSSDLDFATLTSIFGMSGTRNNIDFVGSNQISLPVPVRGLTFDSTTNIAQPGTYDLPETIFRYSGDQSLTYSAHLIDNAGNLGPLPTWLTIDSITGALTISEQATPNAYKLQVTTTLDDNDSSTNDPSASNIYKFGIVTNPKRLASFEDQALLVGTELLVDVGTAFARPFPAITQTLQVDGLPLGLVFDNGMIEGRPLVEGEYIIKVTVNHSQNGVVRASTSDQFEITVKPPQTFDVPPIRDNASTVVLSDLDFFHVKNSTESTPRPYAIFSSSAIFSQGFSVEDIDNDGDIDFIARENVEIAQNITTATYVLYENIAGEFIRQSASSIFQNFRNFTFLPQGTSATTFANFYGDGIPQLIIIDQITQFDSDGHPRENHIRMFRFEDGLYEDIDELVANSIILSLPPVSTSEPEAGIVAADFDGDGDDDLVYMRSSGIRYFENTSGMIIIDDTMTVELPTFVERVGADSPFPPVGTILSTGRPLETLEDPTLSAVDLDNDADFDIIGASAGGKIITYRNASIDSNNNGMIDGDELSFDAFPDALNPLLDFYTLQPLLPHALAAGDIDGDLYIDVLVSEFDTTNSNNNYPVYIIRGIGKTGEPIYNLRTLLTKAPIGKIIGTEANETINSIINPLGNLIYPGGGSDMISLSDGVDYIVVYASRTEDTNTLRLDDISVGQSEIWNNFDLGADRIIFVTRGTESFSVPELMPTPNTSTTTTDTYTALGITSTLTNRTLSITDMSGRTLNLNYALDSLDQTLTTRLASEPTITLTPNELKTIFGDSGGRSNIDFVGYSDFRLPITTRNFPIDEYYFRGNTIALPTNSLYFDTYDIPTAELSNYELVTANGEPLVGIEFTASSRTISIQPDAPYQTYNLRIKHDDADSDTDNIEQSVEIIFDVISRLYRLDTSNTLIGINDLLLTANQPYTFAGADFYTPVENDATRSYSTTVLPFGIALGPDGMLHGIPLITGTFQVVLTASEGGETAPHAFTIDITHPNLNVKYDFSTRPLNIDATGSPIRFLTDTDTQINVNGNVFFLGEGIDNITAMSNSPDIIVAYASIDRLGQFVIDDVPAATTAGTASSESWNDFDLDQDRVIFIVRGQTTPITTPAVITAGGISIDTAELITTISDSSGRTITLTAKAPSTAPSPITKPNISFIGYDTILLPGTHRNIGLEYDFEPGTSFVIPQNAFTTNGQSPFTYTLTRADAENTPLPANILSFDPSTRTITINPNDRFYSFDLRLTADDNDTTTPNPSAIINTRIISPIFTTDPKDGAPITTLITKNVSDGDSLTLNINDFYAPVTNGTVRTYSTSSFLPIGLTLDTAGIISGTPLIAGNSDLAITVTEGTNSATRDISINVERSEHRIDTTTPITVIDLGALNFVPNFIDFDNDGDLDLAYLSASRDSATLDRSSYYANQEGTFIRDNDITARLRTISADFPLTESSFADIDKDGDLDLIIALAGKKLVFFENVRDQFMRRTGDENPFEDIPAQSFLAPAFVDIDDDGDLDLVVGQNDTSLSNGNLVLFTNQTTDTDNNGIQTSEINFTTASSNPFAQILPSNSRQGPIAPKLIDLDRDGDFDLIVSAYISSHTSTILYFENTGTKTNPTFVQTSGKFEPINNALQNVESNLYSAGDIDGDNNLDIIIPSAVHLAESFLNLSVFHGNSYIYKFGNLSERDASLPDWAANEIGLIRRGVNDTVGDTANTITSADLSASGNVIYLGEGADTIQALTDDAIDIIVVYTRFDSENRLVLADVPAGGSETWNGFEIGQDRIVFVLRDQILKNIDSTNYGALGLTVKRQADALAISDHGGRQIFINTDASGTLPVLADYDALLNAVGVPDRPNIDFIDYGKISFPGIIQNRTIPSPNYVLPGDHLVFSSNIFVLDGDTARVSYTLADGSASSLPETVTFDAGSRNLSILNTAKNETHVLTFIANFDENGDDMINPADDSQINFSINLSIELPFGLKIKGDGDSIQISPVTSTLGTPIREDLSAFFNTPLDTSARSYVGESIPFGLILDPNGILSGAPLIADNYTSEITATEGGVSTVPYDFSITINLSSSFSINVFRFGGLLDQNDIGFIRRDATTHPVTPDALTPRGNVIYTGEGADTITLLRNSPDVILVYASLNASGRLVIDDVPTHATEIWNDFELGKDRIVFAIRDDNITRIHRAADYDVLDLVVSHFDSGSYFLISGIEGRNIRINYDATTLNARQSALLANRSTIPYNEFDDLFDDSSANSNYFNFFPSAQITLPGLSQTQAFPDLDFEIDRTNSSVSQAIPENLFTVESGASLRYTVTLADGTALPDGISFDSLSQMFTVTDAASSGQYRIRFFSKSNETGGEGGISGELRGTMTSFFNINVNIALPVLMMPLDPIELTPAEALTNGLGTSGNFSFRNHETATITLIAANGNMIDLTSTHTSLETAYGTLRVQITDGEVSWRYTPHADNGFVNDVTERFTILSNTILSDQGGATETAVGESATLTITLDKLEGSIMVLSAPDTGGSPLVAPPSDLRHETSGSFVIGGATSDTVLTGSGSNTVFVGRGVDSIGLFVPGVSAPDVPPVADTIVYTFDARNNNGWIAFDGADTIDNFEFGTDRLELRARIDSDTAADFFSNAAANIVGKLILDMRTPGITTATGVELIFAAAGGGYGGIPTGNTLTINFAPSTFTRATTDLSVRIPVSDLITALTTTNSLVIPTIEVEPNSPTEGELVITRIGNVVSVVDISILRDADNIGGAAGTLVGSTRALNYEWIKFDLPLGDLRTLTEDTDNNPATYTVTPADTGDAIRLIASYTDDTGNIERVTSNVLTRLDAPTAANVEETLFSDSDLFIGAGAFLESGIEVVVL